METDISKYVDISDLQTALSKEEMEAVKAILSEISSDGRSPTLDGLWQADYEEVPVDIYTFITDRRYLGDSFVSEDGTLLIYKFWVDVLKVIFAPDSLIFECLAGNTKVKLLDGSIKTMEEIHGMIQSNQEVDLYSFDRATYSIVPSKVSKSVCNGIKPIYRITLDNGESFECTSNHRVLLRDNTYQTIDQGLSVGSSLMPFNYYTNEKGYEILKNPNPDGTSYDISTHKIVAKSKYQRKYFKGYHIHHGNYNKKDNRPNNLFKLRSVDHLELHRRVLHNRSKLYPDLAESMSRANSARLRESWSDPDYRNRMIEVAKEHGFKALYDKVGREEFIRLSHAWQSEDPDKSRMIAIQNLSGYMEALKLGEPWAVELNRINTYKGLVSRWSDPDQHSLASSRMSNRNRDPYYIQHIQKCRFLSDINKMMSEGIPINEYNYKLHKSRMSPPWDKAVGWFGSEYIESEAACYNHKIVSIEYVRDDYVYDIEVPYYHNFCLESGAIVHNCGLSGAIGLGKSTIATVGLAYVLYKLLCLKDPAAYYKLTRGSKVAIAIFNISLDQGFGVGFSKLQSMLMKSPWFLEHGTISGLKNQTYYPGKDIEILVGSKMEHFLGRDIFAGFLDEMEFAPGSNPKMELSKIMKLYTTIKRRMESRYMKLGKLPGILFLVSSKKSESDFLEQYLKKNKGKPYLYVVDEPIWVVKADQGRYSGQYFNVAVGNKYLKSKILSDDEDPAPYKANGQEVIAVPVEHREAFELDINSALMDIAGKALSSSLKYIYYDKLKLCYRDYLKNPFTMDELILGFDDDSQIQDFLLMSRLSKVDRMKPHFIHWDTSKSGDATGLAMSTIAGQREVKKLIAGQVYQEEDIIHKLVFAINIRPEPGSEIPFYKIRNFIYYLKFELGYNIVSVTCDSYQSVDTLQQMSLRGFNTKTLSMDRSRVPYDTLKNAINEGRLIMPYIPHLEKELLELEDDKMVGKIDHPVDGSKDTADALAGSVFRSLDYKELLAAQNAQKDAETLVKVNDQTSADHNDWLLGGNRRAY